MAAKMASGAAFRSRTSETYARIREDVICGKLRPGAKLKIEQLARALDVGATPVREALSYLAADGLVMREDQRGFRVAAISASEFEELLYVRCVVEERALRLAIERGGADWEEKIVLARHRLQAAPKAADGAAEWERRHRDFHLALNDACGSSILLRLCGQFFDENNRYRYLSRASAGESRDVAAEHEAIAEATLARDADRAAALLLDHYRRTGDLLRRALAAFNETDEG